MITCFIYEECHIPTPLDCLDYEVHSTVSVSETLFQIIRISNNPLQGPSLTST